MGQLVLIVAEDNLEHIISQINSVLECGTIKISGLLLVVINDELESPHDTMYFSWV